MTTAIAPYRKVERYISPLRYPGGKSKVAPRIVEVAQRLMGTVTTWVEPYAGGGGVALYALMHGVAGRIVLNDADPAVAAFWETCVYDPESLIGRLGTAPLTIGFRQSQCDILERGGTRREVAFALLYLNRVNRAGIIQSGPIGGYGQQGSLTLGARFNRKALQQRVRAIAAFADRITVTHDDGCTVIGALGGEPGTFVYVDPPYVAQGQRLYDHGFTLAEHQRLAKTLSERRQCVFALTYDDCQTVRELYREFPLQPFSLRYSANGAREATELLITSRDISIPDTCTERSSSLYYPQQNHLEGTS